MGKVYTEQNVLDAAYERFETVFREFDNVYISLSGGKDSSVMTQLCASVARKMKRKFSVLYIDFEAQYTATIDHVEELIKDTRDVVDRFYWVCLPLSLRNAVSVIQPKWICWDQKDKKKWVRNMPKNKHVISEKNLPDSWKSWFYHGMEFEDFIIDFAEWFNEENGGMTAAGIGIRTNESLNRFRTIISDKKERYNYYGWTTRIKIQDRFTNVYNFYPIYDWEVEDIWGAVSKLDLKFNYVYELMYKNGLSLHEQRLCQPYGDDQRNGLDQYRYIEPETWEKVLNRVHGVNFGNIYARSSLLGNIKSEKPNGMTWEQYAVFLLESLGLYAPELRDHYYKKIKKFIVWWDKEAGISEIPDDKWEIEGFRQAPYWKRVARAIEKNDFWMTRLSFSQTKSDVERLFELKKKYTNIIYAKDANQKQLREVAEKLNNENDDLQVKFYDGSDLPTDFYSIMGKYFSDRKYRKELPYIVNDKDMEWFLFFKDNDLVGFSSITHTKKKAKFGNMYVVEEYRNDGVWTYMADYLVDMFKAKNLEVVTKSEKLIAAWGKRGFFISSKRGSYSVLRKGKENE